MQASAPAAGQLTGFSRATLRQHPARDLKKYTELQFPPIRKAGFFLNQPLFITSKFLEILMLF
jgi:hypothetical protein